MQDFHAAPDLITPNPSKFSGAKAGSTLKKEAGTKLQKAATPAKVAGGVESKEPDNHLTISQIKQSIVSKCLLPLGSAYLCGRSAICKQGKV